MTDDIENPAAQRLRRRRAVEDEAIRLGAERADLEARLSYNTQDIIDRLKEAGEFGLPLDTFAKLVGVSRQKLYRWRDGP